jgi:hypothetical protein
VLKLIYKYEQKWLNIIIMHLKMVGINGYLRTRMRVLKSEFMHYPTSLHSIWSSPLVKHQSLSHAYNDMIIRIVYHTILSRCFPVTSFCCSVCAQTCCILAVSETEEVPLICTELRYI